MKKGDEAIQGIFCVFQGYCHAFRGSKEEGGPVVCMEVFIRRKK
jgi:hypothetical protein